MEEKIERMIWDIVEHDAFGLHRVDEAAARIAKLVESEVGEWQDEALRLNDASLELEAQLAAVQEALDSIRLCDHLTDIGLGIQIGDGINTYCWYKGEPHECYGDFENLRNWGQLRDKALSAAPEVKNGRED